MVKKRSTFKQSDLILTSINALCTEKINAYLQYYSRTPEEYRKEARTNKIYENSFGKHKFLINYPIVQLDEQQYIVPVIEQLVDTISNNQYFHLLKHFQSIDKKASGQFLTDFGTIFENYVVDMAKEVFGSDKVVSADTIVPPKGGDRCEVVAFTDSCAIAIEVKKYHLKRDAIVNQEYDYIDATLEKVLLKAFKQIENTLDHTQREFKYGLIVIPDGLMALSTLVIYMKKKFEGIARFDNNIFICTLSWYESLISNDTVTIIRILKTTLQRDKSQGKDILHVMGDMYENGDDINFIHEKLNSATESIIKTIV